MSFKNPFALLADDDHSGDEGLAKPSRPTQVDAAPPAGQASKAQSGRINNATTKRSVPGQTVVKQTQAKELPASDAPAGTGFEKENSRDDRGQGRGGRGRGGRGAARGARTGAPRGGEGRRERVERPDRHSATGKTDSAKQEHQAWGGDEGKRELENENAGVTDAAAEKTAGEGETATPAADAEAAAPAAAEEVDNTQSYEEYLASRKAAGRGAVLEGLGQLSIRKANEGQDDSQWKDGVLITKDKASAEEETLFPGQAKEKSVRQRTRKEKNTIETEMYFAPVGDARRGRGGAQRGGSGSGRGEGRGRGGRGRGGEGRGAPRGARGGAARGTSNGVNVEDSAAFPALGA